MDCHHAPPSPFTFPCITRMQAQRFIICVCTGNMFLCVSYQLAAVESERDSLQRRLRALQKTLDEEKQKNEQASEYQAQAIQKAVASRMTQLEELKATDKRIILEVRANAV
jgi:hypothetical protein